VARTLVRACGPPWHGAEIAVLIDIAEYRRLRGEQLGLVTAQVAEEWGRMSATTQPLSIIDGMMAATAKVTA
jgi:hypothetical protein